MGLFAGTGVGKSILLGMMTRYTEADVIVVGLIGERGREVKEFVQEILGPEGIKRACVVAAPADDSPLVRIHGAMLATSVAEYFRDQGKKVLLLMDLCHALPRHSARLACRYQNRPRPVVIRPRYLHAFHNWWNGQAMASMAKALLPHFIRCLQKAMTRTTP